MLSYIPTIIGYIFLIPALVGVVLFFLDIVSITLDSNKFWFGFFRNSSSGRDYDSNGIAALSSPIPIYLGLMAIAGALLIKGNKDYK